MGHEPSSLPGFAIFTGLTQKVPWSSVEGLGLSCTHYSTVHACQKVARWERFEWSLHRRGLNTCGGLYKNGP